MHCFPWVLENNYAKMCDLSLSIPVRVKFLCRAVWGRIWSFLRTSIHLLSKLSELIFWARSSFILWRFCSKPSKACLQNGKNNEWVNYNHCERNQLVWYAYCFWYSLLSKEIYIYMYIVQLLVLLHLCTW